MSYLRQVGRAAEALTNIAHAFTRLADAAEQANEIAALRAEAEILLAKGPQHDSALAPIVLPDKGTEYDPCPDEWDTDDD